ncbi:hypothetical protein BC937DRAFT_94468, partial [Endogone sp. FLAS-F59071]
MCTASSIPAFIFSLNCFQYTLPYLAGNQYMESTEDAASSDSQSSSTKSLPQNYRIYKGNRNGTRLPTGKLKNAFLEQNYTQSTQSRTNQLSPLRYTTLCLKKSRFVGTDMHDYFPDPETVPDNCSFIIANTVYGLPFEDNAFDFVFQRCVCGMGVYAHARFMVSSFTLESWVKAVAEMVRVTKPGGYVELIIKAIEANNIDPKLVAHLDSFLTPHLINVQSDYASFPIGWQGRLGQLNLHNIKLGYEGFKPFMTKWLECTPDEYDEITGIALTEFGKN